MKKEIFKMSDLKKNNTLGVQGKAIFSMVDSLAFKWFIDILLKKGSQLIIANDEIRMNGELVTGAMVNVLMKDNKQKIQENGVTKVIFERNENIQVVVERTSNENFTVILD